MLAIWAVRLFPPVLEAVCVYRLWVEPRVLPSPEAWAAKEGIAIRPSLPDVLREIGASPPGSKP